jgi:hypothetical protein
VFAFVTIPAIREGIIVEITTEEGYPLTALFQRSHPMADRLSAGDTVRVTALRGSVLPDHLGAKEPEYFL